MTGPAGIALVTDRTPEAGERWVYSAGFNIAPGPGGMARVDVEVPDLLRLARAGARVAVLTHQGRYADGTARHLDDLADYLGERLGRAVRYVPDNAGEQAVEAAAALRDGEVALFGNTRLHPGEESNDPDLARRFARLGDRVAVGGFAKAHRAHASNVGILDHLPGCATSSLVDEVVSLSPWAGADGTRYSVAVLGGNKREKVEAGLRGLSRTYDLVIPGGAVLNSLLAALGHPIGRSVLGDDPERAVTIAGEVLNGPRRANIHLPGHVVVARPVDGAYVDSEVVPLEGPGGGVPPDRAIVDFRLHGWVRGRLADLGRGDRVVVAGPPSACAAGHRGAADTLLAALGDAEAKGAEVVLLGGDTAAELPWSGHSSTGGGSALRYLADGTCVVLEALRRNANRRRHASL